MVLRGTRIRRDGHPGCPPFSTHVLFLCDHTTVRFTSHLASEIIALDVRYQAPLRPISIGTTNRSRRFIRAEPSRTSLRRNLT